jgi:hypothetical protein
MRLPGSQNPKNWRKLPRVAKVELADIYVGQLVFAPARTKGSRLNLKVAGKDSVGRR